MKRLSQILILFLIILQSVYADKNDYHRQWKQLEADQNFNEAIQIFTQAAKEYPDEAWFEIYIAHSYKMLGQIDKAIPHYQKAYQRSKNDDDIKSNVFYGYTTYASDIGFKQGNWPSAITWYKKATDVRPDV